jgi:hypothetical protein
MKYPIEEVAGSYHSRDESFDINCIDSCDLSTCSSLSLDFSEVSLPQETSLPRHDNITSKDSELSFFQSNAAIVFDYESSDDFTYETIDSKHDDSGSSSSSSSVCWSESLAAPQSHQRPTAIYVQGDSLVNEGSKHRKNSMFMLSNHTFGAIAHDPEHDDSSDNNSLANSIISNVAYADDDVEYASASESEESSYYEQRFKTRSSRQRLRQVFGLLCPIPQRTKSC